MSGAQDPDLRDGAARDGAPRPPVRRDATGEPRGAASCLDCGAALDGRFCAACGQRGDTGPLSLGALAREAFESVTSSDARLPRTLLGLLRNPGRVAREFSAGRRTRYVGPFRLAVLMSTLWFLALSFFASSAPAERLLAAYGQLINLALMPLFALAFQLCFRWTRARYVEHLVLALYVFGLAAAWRTGLVLVGNGFGLDPRLANAADGLAFLGYLTLGLVSFHAGRSLAARLASAAVSIALTLALSLGVAALVLGAVGRPGPTPPPGATADGPAASDRPEPGRPAAGSPAEGAESPSSGAGAQ